LFDLFIPSGISVLSLDSPLSLLSPFSFLPYPPVETSSLSSDSLTFLLKFIPRSPPSVLRTLLFSDLFFPIGATPVLLVLSLRSSWIHNKLLLPLLSHNFSPPLPPFPARFAPPPLNYPFSPPFDPFPFKYFFCLPHPVVFFAPTFFFKTPLFSYLLPVTQPGLPASMYPTPLLIRVMVPGDPVCSPPYVFAFFLSPFRSPCFLSSFFLRSSNHICCGLSHNSCLEFLSRCGKWVPLSSVDPLPLSPSSCCIAFLTPPLFRLYPEEERGTLPDSRFPSFLSFIRL